MIRISLDLEMNEGDDTSIIQIGSCIFNTETAEILDHYSQIIHQNEEITPYITKLTKITQEKVDNGKRLYDAYLELVTFSTKHNCTTYPMIVWGNGDLQLLKRQVMKSNPEAKWHLGRNELDVKSIYQAFCDANSWSLQGGLRGSLHKMGLTFDGPAHNALKDAVGTAKFYCHLLKYFKYV